MNVGRNLLEYGGQGSGQVQGGGQQKRCLQRQRLLFGMEACTKKQEVQGHESGEKTAGQESSRGLEYNLQRVQSMREDSTEEEEMKRQQRMKTMKDMTKKMRLRGKMNEDNRWWMAELLVVDCEKAWLHPEEEATMQKWYTWLQELKRECEKKKTEEVHQQKVESDD